MIFLFILSCVNWWRSINYNNKNNNSSNSSCKIWFASFLFFSKCLGMSAVKPTIHLYILVLCKGKTSPITVHFKMVHALFYFCQFSEGQYFLNVDNTSYNFSINHRIIYLWSSRYFGVQMYCFAYLLRILCTVRNNFCNCRLLKLFISIRR